MTQPLNPSGRLRPRAMAATYLRELPPLVALGLGIYASASMDNNWMGNWPIILLGSMALLRIITPVYKWYTHRYHITETHFIQHWGIFQKRTVSLAWHDVTAVELHAPWSHRILKLSIVTITSDGSADTTIHLDGVEHQYALQLRSFAQGAGAHSEQEALVPDLLPSSHQEQPSKIPPSNQAVYRASLKDLLAASLFYGQFIVMAGAFLGVLVSLAELTQLAPAMRNAIEQHVGLWLVCFAIAGMAAGIGLTAIQFHNFEVTHDNHSLELRYGLFTTQHRIIRQTEVLGIKLRRNLVEMLFDRVRVSLVTTDSSQQLGTNLVLPSLPRTQVEHIMLQAFPQYKTSKIFKHSGRHYFLVVLVATILPIVLALTTLVTLRYFTTWAWYTELLGTGVIVVLAAVVIRLFTAGFNFSQTHNGTLSWSNLLGAQTEYVLQLASLHAASAVGLGSPSSVSPHLFRIHFYAGFPKTLTGFVRDNQAHAVVELAVIRAAHTTISKRKNKRKRVDTSH